MTAAAAAHAGLGLGLGGTTEGRGRHGGQKEEAGLLHCSGLAQKSSVLVG